MAAVASSSDEAKARLKDFLEKRGKKVLRGWCRGDARHARPPRAPLRPVQARPGRRAARPQGRRHASSAFAAPARHLPGQAARSGSSTGPRPRPTACSSRSARQTARGARSATRRRCRRCAAIAQALLRARPFGRAADRDPVRQRHRARAARARRDDGRHSLCADLGALLADVERLRQAQIDHRNPDAGAGLRRRRQGVRARHRGRGAARRRDRRHRQSARQPARDPVRRTADGEPTDAVDARPRQGRPGHDRQIPVHLGLDRLPQGRHQHPAHAVLEPGDDPRQPGLHRRRAAGAGRLAAVEPHLRRQPRFRHGARTTAARSTSTRASRCPAPSKPPCATCARSRRPSISTCPRASRCCCRICAATRRCGRTSSAGSRCCSTPAQAWRSTSGTSCRRWRRHHGRAHHLPVQPRLDRDRAGCARAHLGIRRSPATSACRCRASS